MLFSCDIYASEDSDATYGKDWEVNLFPSIVLPYGSLSPYNYLPNIPRYLGRFV